MSTTSRYTTAVIAAAQRFGYTTGEALRAALIDAGWTAASHRTTVHRWLDRQVVIPPYAVPYLAAALGLSESTPEEVKARYPDHVWPQIRPRRVASGNHPAASPAARLIAQIQRLHLRSRQDSEQASLKTRELLGSLDRRNYFISSTTSIRNYLWYEGDPFQMVPGRARSIHNKAMFVMLVPTKRHFNRINKHIHTQRQIHDHKEILKGLTTYRRNTVNYLSRALNVKHAEQVFEEGFQYIQCEEFPFTGAGWTVSLLGQVVSEAQVERYGLIHGPYTSGLALQLWDEPNHYFPMWLEGWMRPIVEAEARRARNATRRRFFELLRDRMHGRG